MFTGSSFLFIEPHESDSKKTRFRNGLFAVDINSKFRNTGKLIYCFLFRSSKYVIKNANNGRLAFSLNQLEKYNYITFQFRKISAT